MHEIGNLLQVKEKLNTDFENGLSNEEASSRLEKNGPNKLAEKKKKSIVMLFLSQLANPMIYVLFGAIIVSVIVTIIAFTQSGDPHDLDFLDVYIILGVILLNAIIGTVQEAKAEQALEALKKLSSPTATVKRDGKILEIKAEELVVGDLVILDEGRTVPADIRLIKSFSLKTDESSLTGESLPISKDAEIEFSEEVGVGDRKNVLFMSTPVVYGRGEGVVVGTGMNTEIGKIATLLQETEDDQTPLQKKLAQLSKIIGFLAIGIVLTIFLFGLISGLIREGGNIEIATVTDLLMTAISLAVAAVPEGLPAVVTIVLALGVTRMVKVHTIIRKLPCVETLGAVTVVCSDKTGTLTQNKMTVVEAYVDNKVYIQDNFNEKLNLLASGMSLCSNASVDNGIYGDPTEVALVEFANSLNLKKTDLEKVQPRVDELPFDSVRKMMSTMHDVAGEKVIYTKGAMDQILKHTTHIEIDGSVKKITAKDIQNIKDVSDVMASKALRVLALAKKVGGELEEEGLTFVGLVAMIDPARKEAKPAVASFKNASIVTVMITGDHKSTAYAIASDLGIVEKESQCMTGDQINSLTFEELQKACETTRVFARVSPENKVSIVKAFKANGNIVAMTGDGVNDAPSLKNSDIGIAMGITGTDVAKGAADMVLTDDNFASIEKAVAEGRGIYNNIKKSVIFLLGSNFAEIISMALATFMLLPMPLLHTQILWVNLVTDSLPAIALGCDGKEHGIMNKKPRDPKEGLFAHGGMFWTIFYGTLIGLVTLATFLYYPVMEGINIFDFNAVETFFNLEITRDGQVFTNLALAQTNAFTVLAVSQLFHMIGMSNLDRSFVHVFKGKNWVMLLAFVFGLGAQVAVIEIPFFNDAFGTVPLHWQDEIWVVLAIATTPLIVHELIVFGRWVIAKIKARKN